MAKTIFYGDLAVWSDIMNSSFSQAAFAFEISLGLTGVLTLWLGIMKIGERAGVIEFFGRLISPFFSRLFPGIPKGHPAMGAIFMNISANMLGLDNAATPMGLRAMQEMQSLNKRKDTATDAMIMFLVLNSSGLCLIPISIMMYRAQGGASNPTDIFIPILIATSVATIVGLTALCIKQRIRMDRVICGWLAGIGGVVALTHDGCLKPLLRPLDKRVIHVDMLPHSSYYECYYDAEKYNVGGKRGVCLHPVGR